MQVCSWNDMENEAGKGEPETDESETLMTFPKEKMKNIHLIGGEISLDQNGIEATPGLTAIVSDVTISDNISSLSENMLEDDTKAAFDTDGNLLPMKVEYLKSGDGINTVDEVVETKEIPMKIVSVTVDYKNNGKTALSNVMFNGEKLEISFNVHSGFPLYLSVSGEGPRSSNIRASITAVSTDGLVEIPSLQTEQYQNEEGINPLRYPYCEYLILP